MLSLSPNLVEDEFSEVRCSKQSPHSRSDRGDSPRRDPSAPEPGDFVTFVAPMRIKQLRLATV